MGAPFRPRKEIAAVKLHPRHLAVLAAPLALGACIMGTPVDPGVTMSPLSPSPSVAASPTGPPSASPTAPAASPSALAPGVFFRDDFDGDKLDITRWKVFEREGRVLVADGHLEMLVGGRVATFPLVVPVDDNLPKVGPYYLELRYEMSSLGRISGFNVDYVPPASAADPGVTEPFMRWLTFRNTVNFYFKTESTTLNAVAPDDALKVKTPHRFRLECDGKGTYRVILDDAELSRLQSLRRPSRLWFGAFPNQPVGPTGWATMRIDYVESGVLVTPDPARPRPPSASPTPADMPTAEVSPDVDLSPSPSPSASPEG